MNILLWVLQIALALLCIAGGSYKITHFEQLEETLASMRALPKGLWVSVGAFEALAGLGLILPVVTRWAAAAMALESVLISVLYFYYRDFPPIAFTAVMALMAAFIAFGRFKLRPFS